MTREFLFIFLYGLLSLTAFFLFVFWGGFALRRRARLDGSVRGDRYFLLALGLSGDALGGVLVFGTRVVANLHYGLSQALYGWEGAGIALGLLIMILSKVMLVWLADLEREPPVWTWLKWMAFVTLGWGFLAAAVSTIMPATDGRASVETRAG